MTTAMILQQVLENEAMNVLAVLILIAIVALIITHDYTPKWRNVKKARVFREKF